MTTKTVGLPADAALFSDAMQPSTREEIGEVIQDLVNTVGIRVPVGGFNGYVTTQNRWDLDKAVMTIQPVLLGMMRNGLGYLNTVVAPLYNTQADEVNMVTSVVGNAMPSPTAMYGPPKLLRMRKSLVKSQVHQHDIGFEIAGQLARTQEGAELLAILMEATARGFFLDLAFSTIQTIVRGALSRERNILRDTTAQDRAAVHVRRRDMTALAQKSRTKTNAAIYNIRHEMADENNGIVPNLLIVPREKDALWMDNPQFTNHAMGGDLATEFFFKDENALGLMWQKMKTMTTPNMPDRKHESFQLTHTRVLGDYAVLGVEDDQGAPVWKLPNLHAEAMVQISARTLLRGIPGYSAVDEDGLTLKQESTLHLAFVTALFKTLVAKRFMGPDGKDPKRVLPHFAAPCEPWVTKSNTVILDLKKGKASWTSTVKTLCKDIKDKFDAAPKGTVEKDDVHSDLFEKRTAYTTAADKDAEIQKYSIAMLFSAKYQKLFRTEEQNTEMTVLYYNTANFRWELFEVYAELLNKYYDLFRAMYAAMGDGLKDFFPESFVTMMRVVYGKNDIAVVVADLEAVYTRLTGGGPKRKAPNPEFTAGRETYWTSTGGALKPEVLVLAEDSFLAKKQFLVIRPFARSDWQSMIMMIEGASTIFTTFSEPVVSATEDTGTFINHFHISRNLGAHLVNPIGVKLIADVFCHSYQCGETTGIMSLDEIDTASTKRWVLPNQSSNSMIVIPITKGSLLPAAGLDLHGGADMAEPFEFARSWLEFLGLSGAAAENFMGSSASGQISKFLFQMTHTYTDKSGATKYIWGNTCVGPYGQLPEAASARKTGKYVFPRAIEIPVS
jgi:hypothetical protein